MTNFPGSDASSYRSESRSDADEDYRVTNSVATPPTPISPKASPRHPSDLLKIHRCTYEGCEKSFNRPAKLAQHFRSHTNTRPFVCPHILCTKDFLRESHLKHHIKSAHSDVRDYICEWEDCGKSFVTATRLKRHRAAHEGREKFRCTVDGCSQTFRKHGTLQRHILTVHEGRKPFICEISDFDGTGCQASFDTEGQLKVHTGRVHEFNNFLCTICSYDDQDSKADTTVDKLKPSFSTHAALQEHMKNEHPPTCRECGQNCKSLRDLKSHIEVMHGAFDANESLAHFCPEQGCGRGFTKKGNLKMHIQISHGSNRFVCGEIESSKLSQVIGWDGMNACGKALMTAASLEEHIRIAHQGFTPSHKTKRPAKHDVSPAPARTHQVSILTRLTGAGYEEESRRHIPCLVLGCSHRFLREYDLEVHIQSRHGLADLGVREMLMDHEEMYGRQTRRGIPTSATKQDVNTEKTLDMHLDDDVDVVYENTLVEGASKVDDFWLGGRPHHNGEDNDGWLRDEMEMSCLIDGGYTMERHELVDGQEVDVIDPALQ